MSAHHHPSWTPLNYSGSDVDDDDNHDNNNNTSYLLPPPPMQVGKKRELETEGKLLGGATESSDHDIHIWTERERRKKMRNMFSNLHALLPHLPPKADKSSIVDEAVNYIKTLQETLQRLHKQKNEKLNNNHNNPSIISCSKIVHHPLPTTREAFLADQTSSNDDMSSSATLQLSHLSTTVTPENVTSILPPPSPPSTFQTWTSSNLVLSICGHHAHFCVCSAKKPGLFAALCYVLDKHRIEVVSAHVSSDLHQSFFMIQAHVSGGYNEFGAATVAEDTFKEAAGEIIFWLSS